MDMRKSIDGLMAIVEQELREDAYSGHLFVFVSTRGDRVKILTWDKGGFVLYYKRLEKGRFRLPHLDPDAMSIQIDATQLSMLLDGIDYSRVRRSLSGNACGDRRVRGGHPTRTNLASRRRLTVRARESP
jgi:transposase